MQTLLPAGAGYSTLEIKVNDIRAMTHETGRALCEATSWRDGFGDTTAHYLRSSAA